MKDPQYGKIKNNIHGKICHLRPGTYDIMSQCYKDMDDFLEPITSDKIRDDEKLNLFLKTKKKNNSLKNEFWQF